MAEIHRQYSAVVKLWTGQSWLWPITAKNLNWTAQISRKLRLAERARKDGRRNTPHKDDVQPNLPQQQITVRCRDGAQSLVTELSKRLDRAAYFIAERKPAELVPAAFADKTARMVQNLWATAHDRLVMARRTERQRLQDLHDFQEEHDRVSDASYPDPWPPYTLFLAVALTMLVETGINSGLFAQINIDNFKGGALQALAFSAVNVIFGFLGLGMVASRFTLHKKLLSKIAGWGGTVTLGSAGVMWNLYIAHFRDLIGRLPPGTNVYAKPAGYLNAFSDMAASPFHLVSWQAVALFFIGLAIFAAVAVKGFQSVDDPYPGYGKVDRRHKNAVIAYERRKAALWKASTAVFSAQRRTLDTDRTSETKRVAEIRQIKAEAEDAQREFTESGKALERAMGELIREYRTINQSVRSIQPPHYFASYEVWTFQLPDRTREFEDDLMNSEKMRDRNIAAALDTQRRLNDLEAKMEIDFVAYINGIETMAEKRDEQDNAGNIAQSDPPAPPPPQLEVVDAETVVVEPAPQATNGTGGATAPSAILIVPPTNKPA